MLRVDLLRESTQENPKLSDIYQKMMMSNEHAQRQGMLFIGKLSVSPTNGAFFAVNTI